MTHWLVEQPIGTASGVMNLVHYILRKDGIQKLQNSNLHVLDREVRNQVEKEERQDYRMGHH